MVGALIDQKIFADLIRKKMPVLFEYLTEELNFDPSMIAF